MSSATLSPPAAVAVPAALAPHAARVVAWLTRGAARPPADPAAILRGRGYLAPALLAVAPEPHALAFAVAAFPAKATGRRDPLARPVADAELRLRVAAFTAVADHLDGDPLAALRAAGRLPPDLTDAEAEAFAADLTGTDPLGGYLHLATLTAEQVTRAAEVWRGERELVRAVRGSFLSPPSQFGDAAALAKAFPGVSAEVLAAVAQLERDARAAAGRVLPAGRVADAVADFWERVARDLLRSGFPYFAFRSRFRTWWNQCLLTHEWERPPAALPADPPARADAPADPGDLLRACREVYRVVRTTLFVRSHAEPPGDAGEYRRGADAVWARRLAGEAPEASRESFPWLTAATANNLAHRVRMRVVAGVKARVDRWRTDEIRAMTTPGRMRDEAAVPTVAAVCRAALPTETLAGAFAAHTWIGPVVRPRHADTPTPAELRAEWDVWAAAGFGAVGGRAAAALEAARAEPDALVARARALVGDALPAPDQLRGWARDAGHEWVAPAWFLAAVERREPAWVALRLRPDDDAAAGVAKVAREAMP